MVAYPAVTEIGGGRNDGESVYPRLLLDVEAMSRMFDEKWGMRLDGGCAALMPPALDLWGLFHGERVHVRVLLAPPEDAEPLELLDAHTGVVVLTSVEKCGSRSVTGGRLVEKCSSYGQPSVAIAIVNVGRKV